MKKNLLTMTLIIMLAAGGLLNASWLDDAKLQAEDKLEPLVADIGAGISGAVIANAIQAKFPSVEAGIRFSVAKISDDNDIVDEDILPVPLASARIGLPLGISLFASGMSYEIADAGEKLQIFGVGATYTVLKGKDMTPIPDVNAVLAVNMLSVTDIKVNVTTIGCVASRKLPIITPYVGITYDMTSGSIDTIAGKVEPSKNLFRIAAGVDMKPFPFMFLNAGISNLGYELGTGLRISLPI